MEAKWNKFAPIKQFELNSKAEQITHKYKHYCYIFDTRSYAEVKLSDDYAVF